MQTARVSSQLSSAGHRALKPRSCLYFESRSFHATRQWHEEGQDARAPATSSGKQASSQPLKKSPSTTSPQGGLDLRSLATPGGQAASPRPLIRRTGAPSLHLRDGQSASRTRPPPRQHAGEPGSPSDRPPRSFQGAGQGGYGSNRAPNRFPPRRGRGGAASRGRGGRDNAAGRRGGGGRRGGSGGSKRSFDDEDEADVVTEAMQAYRNEKQAAKRALKQYAPQGVTLEELRPFAPRMPIGVENSVQMLRHRMNSVTDPHESVDATRIVDLANRLRAGKYVYFRSEDEKKLVVEEARRGEERKLGWLKMDGKGEEDKANLEIEVEGLTEQSRKTIEGQIFEGLYPPVTEETKNDKINSIMHLVRKNGTYHAEDEKKLFAKLGSLLPAARTSAKESNARK